jgi:hypothetical protein
MSWALPLPEALRRKIWEMKTQHPAAAIVAEPLEDLFRRGGHVKGLCELCEFYVVHNDGRHAPNFCSCCARECFQDQVVASFPEYMWDPLWEAYEQLGDDAPLQQVARLAWQLLEVRQGES